METQYFKEYSPALGRDMELKVYGHAGRPVLFIPCQNGRFFDFEGNFISIFVIVEVLTQLQKKKNAALDKRIDTDYISL